MAAAGDDVVTTDLEHVESSGDGLLQNIVIRVGVPGDSPSAEGEADAMEPDTLTKTPNRRQRYRASWEKIDELKGTRCGFVTCMVYHILRILMFYRPFVANFQVGCLRYSLPCTQLERFGQ